MARRTFELTPNEQRIHVLYLQGLNYREIAIKLNKKPTSISHILTVIKDKLKVS